MNTLILLLAITVGADDSSIQQAFHKDVATGVVTAASAIRKERGATEAVKLLLQCLRDDDVELRAAAPHALGTMGDDGRRALPELIAALNNDEASEFAEALVKLGRGDISVWLAQAIIEPYQGIGDPYCALWTLVLGDGGKDERIVPILQKGLGHASFDVQWKAAALLGDIGPKAAPARQALVRLLEEEPKREKRPDEFFSSGEVRGQAACALGQIGAEPEQTAKLLTTMIRHSDPEIRTWSAVGLAPSLWQQGKGRHSQLNRSPDGRQDDNEAGRMHLVGTPRPRGGKAAFGTLAQHLSPQLFRLSTPNMRGCGGKPPTFCGTTARKRSRRKLPLSSACTTPTRMFATVSSGRWAKSTRMPSSLCRISSQ